MSELFYSIYDLPIKKKPKYQNRCFYWNSIPRSSKVKPISYKYRIIKSILPKYGYRHADTIFYFQILAESKVVLNTLSPGGLVGPRFYESMASGSVVLCEESPLISNVLPENTYVAFKPDMADFEAQLNYVLDDEDYRTKIVNNALQFVFDRQSWESRVKLLLREARKYIR